MEASQVRARDRRYVWHPWSPLSTDRSSLTLTHGIGYRVWDIDGKEYIDGSSLNSTCGYAHPGVAAAAQRQLLALHGLDLSVASHPAVGALAQRLASHLPEALAKHVFVNSGSEGIEAAVLIAASYWEHMGERRPGIVAFARGYHGSTVLSRSLTALPRVGHPFQAPFPVTHVEFPVAPRELRRPEALAPLLQRFRDAIGSPSGPPMAVVVEPFINVGGGVVLPTGFLRGLRELCDDSGTLLVVDEVFTGYGRCGRMFACQREDVEPDILVSSKGLASGYLPIAAVAVERRIHDSFELDRFIGGLRYGHTTSGHAVACAAALATLDLIEKEQLPARADHFGSLLLERFAALAGRGQLRDVRGLGLIIVLELAAMEAATRVVARARESGLLLRQHGEVIMLVPPLSIDAEGISAIAARLELALADELH